MKLVILAVTGILGAFLGAFLYEVIAKSQGRLSYTHFVALGVLVAVLLIILMLRKKREKATAKFRDKEMNSFLLKLKRMDSEEIGKLAFAVAKAQMEIESNAEQNGFPAGVLLTEPHAFLTTCPDGCEMLNKQIIFAEKNMMWQVATGMKPWLYTLGAVAYPELYRAACEIWGEVARGFPHASAYAAASYAGERVHAFIGNIPEGFGPKT